MNRLVGIGALALLTGPGLALAAVSLLLSPTGQATCAADLAVGNVPGSLTSTTSDGVRVVLDRTQLARAATIVTVGQDAGVPRRGVLVALMAALTESSLRNLANTSTYPASADVAHDGDGSDHDSLGLFQMRPSTGWGSVNDVMDPTYEARAFYGGPAGPNHGSPRGLLDIPGWDTLAPGRAAQAVEVSAYPDRYARFEPVAQTILTTLTATTTPTPAPASSPTSPTRIAQPISAARLPISSTSTDRVVFPLPDGTWTRTSGFGMRLNPILHVWLLHAGVDLAAAPGTPVLATADGRVVAAGPVEGLGNRIVLTHVVDRQPVGSVYGHLRDGGIHVHVGQYVLAGQHIGDVGSTGNSTGPHLHFEIHPGGPDQPAVNPQPWLDAATHLTSAHVGAAQGVDPSGTGSCTAGAATP